MTELHDFEEDIRAMLTEVERQLSEPPSLADRLISGASQRWLLPHRVEVRHWRRWLPPLLAAAAVIAVVVAVSVALSSHPARQAPATHVPTPSLSSSPPTNPASTGTPSPSPTKTGTQHTQPIGSVVPPGFAVRNIDFRDSAHGYALGNVPCSASPGYCATLVRTDDGGLHWAALSLPQGLTPVDDKGNKSGGSCGDNGNIYGPCVDKVVFADALHGYVFSFHSFYSTNDGGATWTNENARATQVVIAGNAVVRIAPIHDCSSGCPGRVDVTTVGSNRWREIQPSGTRPGLFNSQVVASGSILYFEQGSAGTSADVVFSEYRSSDGGQTWSKLNGVSCEKNAYQRLVPASDGSVALLCNSVQVLPAGSDSFGPAHPIPNVGSDISQSDLIALSANDLLYFVKLAATTAQPWTMYRSSDGGRTWNNSTQTAPWQSLTAQDGYRFTYDSTTVAITTDSGQTFTLRAFN